MPGDLRNEFNGIDLIDKKRPLPTCNVDPSLKSRLGTTLAEAGTSAEAAVAGAGHLAGIAADCRKLAAQPPSTPGSAQRPNQTAQPAVTPQRQSSGAIFIHGKTSLSSGESTRYTASDRSGYRYGRWTTLQTTDDSIVGIDPVTGQAVARRKGTRYPYRPSSAGRPRRIPHCGSGRLGSKPGKCLRQRRKCRRRKKRQLGASGPGNSRSGAQLPKTNQSNRFRHLTDARRLRLCRNGCTWAKRSSATGTMPSSHVSRKSRRNSNKTADHRKWKAFWPNRNVNVNQEGAEWAPHQNSNSRHESALGGVWHRSMNRRCSFVTRKAHQQIQLQEPSRPLSGGIPSGSI